MKRIFGIIVCLLLCGQGIAGGVAGDGVIIGGAATTVRATVTGEPESRPESRVDSLVADWRELTGYLEATHPDPYTAFGGRPFFRREVERVEGELCDNITVAEFGRLAGAFLARLEDGHTFVNTSGGGVDWLAARYPISASAMGDGLVVDFIAADRADMIGARVESIGGVGVDELLDRVRKLSPVENESGAMARLGGGLFSLGAMRQLVPELGTEVEVVFRRADGEEVTVGLEYVDAATYEALYLDKEGATVGRPVWNAVDESEFMNYRFVDSDRKMMLFRYTAITSREALERVAGWPNREAMIRQVYDYVLGREMPEDLDEAVAGVPSLHETFAAMLAEMKREGAPYLVIDLRGNDGGFTPTVFQTIYQIWGEKYMSKDDFGTNYCQLVSPLYLRKTGMTLDEYNESNGTNVAMGDFMFAEWDGRESVDRSKPGAIYEPERVFVLTDAGTFSAAFHYAFFLWKMGATVVGTPSGQAPNSFMEVTPFELTHTGVRGSISNSMQVFVPSGDRRARVFWPDVMLSPEDYKKYGFDKYSEVLYLLDHLNLDK